MVKIAPSILTADLSNLEKQIRFLEEGNADLIHIDVMDGSFVPNITFGPLLVKTIQKITNIPLDVHLMIINPEKYVEQFIDSGASYLTIHQEATLHLHRTIEMIKKLGAKAGVSLNPATSLSTLDEILQYLDLVLIMSVNPGFGGQTFIESSLQKISRLKKMISSNKLNTLIEVDGGINLENVEKVVKAGTDILVIGNSIFSSTDIPSITKIFKSRANFDK
ncbi:MAG TPA: ribulose-phosphate 3-epimerase [Bacteroidota bacterium]|nr:ribulose-phosphate 3-epimerase [Bacteroidota bacterium]